MMIMIAMRLKIIEDEAGDRLIMKIEDYLNEIISTLLLIFKLECKEAKKQIYYSNVKHFDTTYFPYIYFEDYCGDKVCSNSCI